MKKKALQFAIGLFVISNGAFAQWGGSTTTSGDIYRDGNVGIGIGTSGFVPLKLTIAVNQQNDGIWLSGTGSKNIALLNNVTNAAWNGLSQSGDHLLFWKTPTIDDPNAGGLVIGPWSNGNNGMRITSAGNVGIGTGQTSFHRLNVAGTVGSNGVWVANSNTASISLLNNLTPGAWNALTQQGDNLLMWKGASIDQPEGGLVIAPWSNSSKGIRITGEGNVGIGTSNPGSFKLAVEGKIAARGIKVTVDPNFPDYVFDSAYQLKPLAHLEQYINKNKHLPGIPSAEEVKKEGGIELGDMNVKLLEKIEELTLYVIELKKENEQMKKEIKEMKEKQ
ncbi:MAG: hypothetical protein ACJ748_01465 [Flavisolibacter sp.]